MGLNNLKTKQSTPLWSWMVESLFLKETVCFKKGINPVLSSNSHKGL